MATFSAAGGDIIGTWLVPLQNGLHTVQFEHGTVTGKRVVLVDEQPVVTKKMQFKLVGNEDFLLGEHKCSITIEPYQNMSYVYNLKIDGADYDRFIHAQRESLRFWRVVLPNSGSSARTLVILDKDAMEVSINGMRVETTDEFCEDGAELHFLIPDGQPAKIRAVNSGARNGGVEFFLIVGDEEFSPTELLPRPAGKKVIS